MKIVYLRLLTLTSAVVAAYLIYETDQAKPVSSKANLEWVTPFTSDIKSHVAALGNDVIDGDEWARQVN